MTGAELIAAERQRQIDVCRRDDTKNDNFQLTDCALMIAQDVGTKLVIGGRPNNYWPAERAEHVKEKYGDNIVARLAIAGALIAAEIDRLQAQNDCLPDGMDYDPAHPPGIDLT